MNRPKAAPQSSPAKELPPLETGDHLDQPTFHARYEAMPPQTRAELIGGVVYMPSPVYALHAEYHPEVIGWLFFYKTFTPGLRLLDNVSVALAEDGEVQPDACLLIRPERGGQTREQDGYFHGAPELVVEVASSSVSYDLHSKKREYERAGVLEYVVLLVREPQVLWFALRDGRFEALPPGEDGIYRSAVFPGLWLDPAALLRLDSAAVLQVLQRGLASPEHEVFARRMQGEPA
jgi:Uma2 family endonuclease